MKRFLFSNLVLCLFMVSLIGCTQNPAEIIDPTKPVAVAQVTVEPVSKILADDLSLPDATTASESFTEDDAANLTTIVAPLMSDSLVVALQQEMASSNPVMKSALNQTTKALQSRSIAETMTSEIEDIQNLMMQLPETKRFSKTIHYAEIPVDSYVWINNIDANVELNVKTTDGNPIDTAMLANFGMANLKATLATDIEMLEGNLPVDSSIKDINIRFNAKANASCGSMELNDGSRIPNYFNVALAADLCIGITVDDGSKAGLIIVSVSTNNFTENFDITVPYDPASLINTINIKIEVCDKLGNSVYSKIYETVDEFLADYPVTTVPEPAI